MQHAIKNYTLKPVTDYTAYFKNYYLLLQTLETYKESI